MLPYRNIAVVMPAALVLLYRISIPLAKVFGLIRDDSMDGVIPGRIVPVYADANGQREGKEAIGNKDLCVIMLAARSNHALGLLAPGYKAVGDFMTSFVQDLSDNAEENGFLGASNWISNNDRGANNETMGLLYFETPEHLHNWSHGPKHTEAMNWWKNDYDKWGHIGIIHEVFTVPRRNWEGVYNNYHPTGLGATATSAMIKDDQGERKVWINPLVKGTGPLKYSKVRMNRTIADEEKQMLDALAARD